MKKYVITVMIAVIIIACVGTIKFCNKDTSNILHKVYTSPLSIRI